uniref:Uncharacterized protein n=1 Tax=Pithovirus LCDPAC02 TaxID=2506601 RepID=A0A481YQJ2_9VIRU|nr:MAG: hypothetical protein LCDPAC02_02240 [Pithovirus LCDPAC02]
MFDILTKVSNYADYDVQKQISLVNRYLQKNVNPDKELINFLNSVNFDLDKFIDELNIDHSIIEFKIAKFRQVAKDILQEASILVEIYSSYTDDNVHDILEYSYYHAEELARLLYQYPKVEKMLNINISDRFVANVEYYIDVCKILMHVS